MYGVFLKSTLCHFFVLYTYICIQFNNVQVLVMNVAMVGQVCSIGNGGMPNLC